MDKNKNMKGFIFTLDAVFSLIVASAAISILLYVHFTQPLAYQTPVAYTSTVLSNLLNTKLGQIASSGITSNPIQTGYKNPTGFGYLNQKGQTPTHYILVNDTQFNDTFAKNNAITLSAWVYEFPNSECEVSLANIYNLPGTSGEAVFRFGVSGGSGWATSINAVMLELWDAGNPIVQTNMFSSTPVQYNTWSYITAVYNGTYVNFYVNGAPAGSTAYSSTLNSGASSVLLIGANPNSGCYSYFPGYISNLQIYNTPLSNSQVRQLYNEGIAGAPASNAGLIGWYPLNGNANDYSGNNNGAQHGVNFVNTSYVAIGNYNATDNSSLLYTLSELYLNNESTYADFIAHNIGVNNTSGIFINDTYAPSYSIASFNGISSYITTDKPITNSIGNWTIEAWINPANLNQLGIAVENGWDNNVVGNGYGFGISNGGLGAGSQLFGLFSGVTTINTGYTFSNPNKWYDIAMTRNQSGVTSFYVDGIQTPSTSSSIPLTSNDFYIGSNTGIRYFNGSIADVQI